MDVVVTDTVADTVGTIDGLPDVSSSAPVDVLAFFFDFCFVGLLKTSIIAFRGVVGAYRASISTAAVIDIEITNWPQCTKPIAGIGMIMTVRVLCVIDIAESA